MAVPALQINNLTPIVPDADHHIAATRKSLHQNIFGKLRPLPFQYHWTIWHDKNITSPTTYTTATTNQLYILHEDVADIATFYRVYNNYPWEKVRARDSIHIFRQGVQPSPKDPENRDGGCWRFRVPKAKAQAFFHELAILCMANELQAALEGEHDHVLGITSSVQFNSHLISVWNKKGHNERSVRALEQTILCRLSPELRPGGSHAEAYAYRCHADCEIGSAAIHQFLALNIDLSSAPTQRQDYLPNDIND